MLESALQRKAKLFSRHKKSLQHIAVLFSGKAGVQVIGLISQPVLARLYTPSQFGEFAVLNSLLAILLVASSGRYESGIILTRRIHNAKRLFQVCQIALICYLGILVTAGFLLPASELESWAAKNNFPVFYIWLIPVMILFSGYWQILEKWLIRLRKYSQISLALISQRILIFTGAITLAFFPFNINGLIIGQLIGFTGIFIFSIFLHREPLRIPLKATRAYAYSFREFPFYSVPSLYILLFIYHLPVLWISYYSNKELTGYYNMAFTLVMLPLTALSMSTADIYYERLVRSDNQRQYVLIQKSLLFVTAILFPFAVLIFFHGETLTVLLLGPEWQKAGYIASLLSPFVLFQGLCSCLTIPLNIYRKQSLALLFQILKLAFWILAFWTGYYLGDFYLSFKLVSFFSLVHLAITAGVMYPIIKKKHAID